MTTEIMPQTESEYDRNVVTECYCGANDFESIAMIDGGDTEIYQCHVCGKIYEGINFEDREFGYRLLIAWHGFLKPEAGEAKRTNTYACTRCGGATEWNTLTHRSVCIHPLCHYERYIHGRGKSHFQNTREDQIRRLKTELVDLDFSSNRFLEIIDEISQKQVEIAANRTDKIG